MRRYDNYTLEKETWDEQRAAGRYNPATVLVARGYRFTLGAGDSDNVDVYREGELLFVVSVNSGLNYAGLQVLNLETGQEDGEAFLQADYEIDDILGPRGVDLHPRNIAKRLADYALV